ncbi:MAG: FAD-dependent oxidoreductase [Actinomycetales bacterium]
MQVVVIGAGIVGLCIAEALVRSGADTVLVDPDSAGGATRAAAGMLSPVGETYHQESDLGSLLLAGARTYPGFIARLAGGRDAEAVGLRTTGTLICGTDNADRTALSDLHEVCLAHGLRSQRLTTRQARRLEPLLGPALSCAFLAPDDHQVDPRLLAEALLAWLGERCRFECCPATAVLHRDSDDSSSPATGVLLGDGRQIGADAVVVANALGAQTIAGLPTDVTTLLRPVFGDVLRLRPPAALAGLVQHTIRARVAGTPVYVVPRPDGGLVLGATSREDGEPLPSAGGMHQLLRDAIRLVPAVAEFAVTELIARPRPGTPDNAPLLGLATDSRARVTPGLVLATGFFRHGVLLAPLAGHLVCSLLGLPTPEPPHPGSPEPRHPGTPDRPPPSDRIADLLAIVDPARFTRAVAPHAPTDSPISADTRQAPVRTR